MKRLKDLKDSKLFKRLQQAPADSETTRSQLVANVRTVAEQSGWISEQINRFLPQYTLHGQTHLFNVLSIMEELLPPASLKHLSPLECALCILAAFTHDLGMALSDEEHQRLTGTEDTPERRQFLRHRDERFAEDARQIQFLRTRNTPDSHHRADLLEGHILADHLRRTHAADTKRIASWFEKTKQTTQNQALYQYGNLSFERELTLIAISHNQEAHWLRQQFTQGQDEDNFLASVGSEERVNFAFPGLLLRLADYMDFDATRAPAILFHHFGIDDCVSVKEWQKHMAITGWGFKQDGDALYLRYEARNCEHPVIHKTICDFCRDIEQEVRRTGDEMRHQQRTLGDDGAPYTVRLPDRVEARVSPRRDAHDRDAYVFHDLQFRLDQDEIQQLLMGEALWGDPSLAIRELLQNALDALQMRDLRLKLLRKDPKAAVEPTDALPEGEELAVRLTWGTDLGTGQEFIRVSDSGSGMTEDVLENFFTQIGKSYYRSPDFTREQALLRAGAFFATPISHFGIGILSCFMIGDRLEVRTRAGHSEKPGREAWDLTVSGPGSLFWLRPGTLDSQGTEVTVFLKSRFRLHHKPDRLVGMLKEHFRYGKDDSEARAEEELEIDDAKRQGLTLIDPPLIAAKHVVWPMFPLLAGPEGCAPTLRLDDRFHIDHLNPIPVEKVRAKAREWHCPPEWLGDLHWEFCDWTDDQAGDQATGSRVRLIYPMHFDTDTQGPCDPPTGAKLCRQDEIAAFVEATLQSGVRTRQLIKSMEVHKDESGVGPLLEAGLGSFLWIDLRGHAAPRVTADRQKALPRTDVEDWPEVVRGIFRRWADHANHVWEARRSRNPLWLQALAWDESLRPTSEEPVLHRIAFGSMLGGTWVASRPGATRGATWLVESFLQQSARSHAYEPAFALDRDLDRDRDFVLDITRALDRDLDRAFALGLARKLAGALTRDLDRAFARNLASALTYTLALDCAFPAGHDPDCDLLLRAARSRVKGEVLLEHLYLSVLAEAFQPALERSFPPLGCGALRGIAGNGILAAPLTLDFQCEPDGCTTAFADEGGKVPAPLVSRGYALVFPLTNIPLGRLRRECPAWREHRAYRPLGILPFFLPSKHEELRKHAAKLRDVFRVPAIQALLPKPELWGKLFKDWTEEDWRTCGLSALWDIPTGQVLWAEGAHTTKELHQTGKPFTEFFWGEES